MRNQFLHYYPLSIAFGKQGFIQVAGGAIELIEFLLLESGNIMINSEQEELSIRTEITDIKKLTKTLKESHPSSPL